ncbi:hypothetical protein AHAS_Ahas17G0303700 [Arachis hypogaea]
MASYGPSGLPIRSTSIATLFGEYSAMTRAQYMTNGHSNGRTTATIDCERGIYNQSPTLARPPIIGVGSLEVDPPENFHSRTPPRKINY